jgi:hypothetical protein
VKQNKKREDADKDESGREYSAYIEVDSEEIKMKSM